MLVTHAETIVDLLERADEAHGETIIHTHDEDDANDDEDESEENSGDEENPYGDYPPDDIDGLNKPFNIMKASQDTIDIEIGNLPNFNLNFNPNT